MEDAAVQSHDGRAVLQLLRFWVRFSVLRHLVAHLPHSRTRLDTAAIRPVVGAAVGGGSGGLPGGWRDCRLDHTPYRKCHHRTAHCWCERVSAGSGGIRGRYVRSLGRSRGRSSCPGQRRTRHDAAGTLGDHYRCRRTIWRDRVRLRKFRLEPVGRPGSDERSAAGTHVWVLPCRVYCRGRYVPVGSRAMARYRSAKALTNGEGCIWFVKAISTSTTPGRNWARRRSVSRL